MDGFGHEPDERDSPQELVREPPRALWSPMWRRMSRLLRRAAPAAADDAPPEEREVEPEPPVDTRTFAPWARLPPELATHDNYLDEWTLVYKVVHTLAVPRSLAGRRVLVEIDCRDHDCNAAIHNIFFNLAF